MPYTIERKPTGNISNTGRIDRTLKLIIYLKQDRTVKECANYIQVTPRSIQRYFQLLMRLGFKMETNIGRRYSHKLTNVDEYFNRGERT